MRYGPDNEGITYVAHDYDEQTFYTGEVDLNYAKTGDSALPALLLIPGQTESWWGYESVMALLAEHFEVFAVDLRGQGRSTRTPGRYTWDNFGNDLVRLSDGVIRRPHYVAGLSSGGVLAAWLSAFAPQGMIKGAYYEDPPLFAAELMPGCGQGIRQGAGPLFKILSKYLGDQWSIGDVAGLLEAAPDELPPWMAQMMPGMVGSPEAPGQSIKEYDPEWGRAFWEGSVGVGCDHQQMLSQVKCPVLFTHHARQVNEQGFLMGAISDLQVQRVRELVESAGQTFTYESLPEMPHSLHGADPELYVSTLTRWVQGLDG